MIQSNAQYIFQIALLNTCFSLIVACDGYPSSPLDPGSQFVLIICGNAERQVALVNRLSEYTERPVSPFKRWTIVSAHMR